MYKAVIWDIDGTLIDSEPVHLSAVKRVLGYYTDKIIDENFIQGKTTKQILQSCLVDSDEILLAQYEAQIIAEYANKINPNYIRTVILDVIKNIGTSGVSQCCASNGEKKVVRANVGLSRIFTNNFRFALSSEDVAHPKPAPDLFNLACKKLAVAKKNALVIEDSYTGIMASLNANINAILLSQDEKLLDTFAGVLPIARDTSDLKNILIAKKVIRRNSYFAQYRKVAML